MTLKKKKDVIKYVSKTPELEEWIRDFAQHLETSPEKNVVEYPEEFASGYAKVGKVDDGLTYRIVNYRLNSDFLFQRKPAADFYLIIYFYKYKNCRRLELDINRRQVLVNKDADYSSLLMTNSFASQKLKLTKDTMVQGVTIQMTEEWLVKNLNSTTKVNLDLLKKKDVLQSLIKPSYDNLMDEIFEKNPRSHFPELFLLRRVAGLLELFFDEIFRNGLDANVLPASTQDVHSLLRVQEYLLERYDQPFPTIPTLARMAMMSESKLKQVFKKAFGMSLFEYFQQNRMLRAKDMLMSDLHSVTEVGTMLGYHNLSNFSAAFKKEFGVLPKNADKAV